MTGDLTIGRVARQAGVGTETVRFYERRGLIAQPPKPQSGGYRVYPLEVVRRIRFIRDAQALGFSLAEIEELLDLRTDDRADCADVRSRAEAKLEEVREKIARLRTMAGALEMLIAACPGAGTVQGCTILEALEGARTGERPSPRARRTRADY